ncbi:hypothetical protein F5B22DRAFT_654799 [Xylaria bambusicola]|uniref:uncharacterized protein n=1 Tax=Xylaria bambusicola TaxID=326684 RepID=UPI00200887FD|nr:uncharacterized protein F5B22DRAFT_654799 [Xylaria bambusicola]KAI0517579.1 hypothetical protein F5B22DRAFT_654799 [Xylaria bambusicola]
MDVLDELESLAAAVVQQSEQPDEPDHNDIKQWQSLFGLTYAQSLQEIQAHRSNLSRTRVSDSHWEIVRAEKEAQGFSREAYEYSATSKATKPSATRVTHAASNQSYLLKLEGPLGSAEVVKRASRSKKDPAVYYGTDDDDKPAIFCKVDSLARSTILAYLSEIESRFQPTFIKYSIATKELSRTSAYPTLGIDATMPQYRPSSTNDTILTPSQNQYPVCYFFYGTLADPTVLGRLLGIEPVYKDATVYGGTLCMWGGKYKAMIDKPRGVAHGNAFWVQNQAQEEILRCYETDKYEVGNVTPWFYETTLIAAAGSDASFGLAGIDSTMRHPSVEIQLPNHLVLVSTHREANLAVAESPWNTRGWTYQEGLFARRRLYFLPNQMYWQCRGFEAQESFQFPYKAIRNGVLRSSLPATGDTASHSQSSPVLRVHKPYVLPALHEFGRGIVDLEQEGSEPDIEFSGQHLWLGNCMSLSLSSDRARFQKQDWGRWRKRRCSDVGENWGSPCASHDPILRGFFEVLEVYGMKMHDQDYFIA